MKLYVTWVALVMSPDFFNYYSEQILGALEQENGLEVSVTNIRYVDDTVLIAEIADDLQILVNVAVSESDRKGGLYMVVSKEDSPRCLLKVKDENIKQIDLFNYLGIVITADARCIKEIKRRIALAKVAFAKLESILRICTLSMATRLRVLQCYVYPVLLDGCETWTITNDMSKRFESCELWFLKRMMRIPWMDKVSNARVLRIAKVNRMVMTEIRRGQLQFLG